MKTLKFYKYNIIFIALICMLLLCGCQNGYDIAIVEQDSELTGGNLSFYYDQDSRTINVGGEGEVILYYQTNLIKGWEEEGNRIGLKFNSPKNLKSFEDIKVKINGKEVQNLNFYTVNNEKTGSFAVYPLIKDVQQEIEINVSWESNSKEQTYYLKINPNTILMKK